VASPSDDSASSKPREPRRLTRHALRRYRQRVDAHATDDDVQAALENGTWRFQAPGWSRVLQIPSGVVVGSGYAFVMRGNRAVTVIVKRRIPKADRRLYREEQRPDWR